MAKNKNDIYKTVSNMYPQTDFKKLCHRLFFLNLNNPCGMTIYFLFLVIHKFA